MKKRTSEDLAAWSRLASRLESRLLEPRPAELTESILAHRRRYRKLLGELGPEPPRTGRGVRQAGWAMSALPPGSEEYDHGHRSPGEWGHDLLATWARDTARTFVCAWALVAGCRFLAERPLADWLIAQADPLWRHPLQLAIGLVKNEDALVRSVTRDWPMLGDGSCWEVDVDPGNVDGCMPQSSRVEERFAQVSDAGENTSWFITHFFERLLAGSDPEGRQRQGVYYTPRAVVQRMVLDVDTLLRQEFGLADGVADAAGWKQVTGAGRPPSAWTRVNGAPSLDSRGDPPFLHFLDPAAGSGAFLVEVIEQIARRYNDSPQGPGDSQRVASSATTFDEYLVQRLDRMRGFECLLPACLAAQLNVAAKLAEVGFRFTREFAPLVQLRDTLAGPPRAAYAGENDQFAWPPTDPARRLAPTPFTVILGNPPFSGSSRNDTPWINQLLRGTAADDPAGRNYFAVDGRPLREKKVWLHDDYVKFFRYAQWLVDQAGTGLMAFVSNHGYLDNITFRGMRQSLLESFPLITILDLHGNRKRHEVTENGQPDYNLFDIAQGTAIGYFRAPNRAGRATRASFVRHDLRGTQEEKLAWLRTSDAWHVQSPWSPSQSSHSRTTLAQPAGPLYGFSHIPSTDRDPPSGIPLTELMPSYSSVPVTARDHLVIAFSEEELAGKLADFADLEKSDDEIRRILFQRARSSRYPAGDTRGWKLAAARQRMSRLENPRALYRECLYRPWDWRKIFWAHWMVDWPRWGFMEVWQEAGNWGLITRRQMLPDKPCNFVWVADSLVMDGVIRSDNRGNEYLFPIYRRDPVAGEPTASRAGGSARPGETAGRPPTNGHAHSQRNTRWVANFSSPHVEAVSKQIHLTWAAKGRGDMHATWGPEDLGHYLYALFQAGPYQRAYAPALRTGFPRVVFPRDQRLLQQLCLLGRELATCHMRRLLPDDGTSNLPTANPYPAKLVPPLSVAPRYPRYEQGRIWISREESIAKVEQEVWEYRAGAHQVAAKWLADRRGRILSHGEWTGYQQLLNSIQETSSLQKQLNDCLESPRIFEREFQ